MNENSVSSPLATMTQARAGEAEWKAVHNQIHTALRSASEKHSKFLDHVFSGIHNLHVTRDCPTLMVSLDDTGNLGLHLNPDFLKRLDCFNTQWALLHEALHLTFRHLGQERRGGEWHTKANELFINHVVRQLLGDGSKPAPQLQVEAREDGEPVLNPQGTPTFVDFGWDPVKFHLETYAPALMAAGIKPKKYQDLYASGDELLDELLRHRELLEQSRDQENEQGAGDGGSQDGEPSCSWVTAPDQEGQGPVDDHIERALYKLVTNAGASDSVRKELRTLVNATGGTESETWGPYGVSSVLGTVKPKPTNYWMQFLVDAFRSKTEPERRLHVNLQTWSFFTAKGLRPVLSRSGEREISRAAIFFDGSLSMGTLPTVLADLVGTVEGCQADFYMFDHDIAKIYDGDLGAVGPLVGGGGTQFDPLLDVAEGRRHLNGVPEDAYDVHLVVTDGYAPPVTPQDPDKWIWLITHSNENPSENATWPQRAEVPMVTIPVPEHELYAARL